ncbi:MAG: hypothetical protein V2A62_04035 [Candidatus Woesearchaeota archaeon]
MKTIHRILGLAALLIGLAGPAAEAKTTGSVEVMGGDKTTLLDVKVSGELAPKVKIFSRGKTSIDYANSKEVRYFGLVDIARELGSGFDVVAEVQFIQGVGPVPRLGVQYFGQKGGFSGYGLITGKIDQDSNLGLVADLRYKHRLSEALAVSLGVEEVTSLGSKGHEFSTQSIRTGLEIEGFHFGPAVDLIEVGQGKKLQFGYNVGGFLRKDF